MKRVSGTVLGIAITERGMALAEVSGTSVSKTALWERSPGVGTPGLSEPEIATAGAEFRKFLKEKGFASRQAIVGLPAKWITAKPWQVPPSAPSAAAAILRLAAERQFPPELKDFVFDYAGSASPSEPTTVLLAGTSQQRIRQIVAVCEAAGLNVLAVSSSTLALAAVLSQNQRKDIVLALNRDAAELVVQAENGPRSLRHLAVAGEQLISSNGSAAPALATLGSELMRTSLASGNGANGELLLWDSLGLHSEAVETLRSRYSLNIAPARNLGSASFVSGQNNAEYGPAASLALLALNNQGIPLDFLHSRLIPPRQTKLGPKVYWGVAAGVVLLLAVGLGFWSLHEKQLELAKLNDQLAQLQNTMGTAKAMVAKVSAADGWYANRPSMLDCMEHVTAAFPAEGVIWATNISVRDTGAGTITGRARDQSQVLLVYDRMKNDAKFSRVVVNDIRQGTGSNSRDITFSISFGFAL